MNKKHLKDENKILEDDKDKLFEKIQQLMKEIDEEGENA